MTAASRAPHVVAKPWATRALYVLWRFVACLLVLSLLAYWHGADLTDRLLPAFRAEINWLDDTYRIDRLLVDTDGADQVVRIVVGLNRCVVLPDGAHCADPRGLASAATLVGHVTLPAILMLAIVLSWPVNAWREWIGRLLLWPASLALLWALDVPLTLWGLLWRLHVDAFVPGLFSPLLVWGQFLEGGGRMVLAVALASLVIGIPAFVGRSARP